jgi:hypothetical protein
MKGTDELPSPFRADVELEQSTRGCAPASLAPDFIAWPLWGRWPRLRRTNFTCGFASVMPRLLAAAALLSTVPRGRAQEGLSPDLAPGKAAFARPKVPAALFTHEKTALLAPECERIASFLARHAAAEFTAGILRGDAKARNQGRLLLTVSLHLAPLNAPAVHCANAWSEARAPKLPPPGEDLRLFTNFLLSAAQRQAGEPGTARDVLARVLIRLAADLDPENEDAIYASELQDRAGKAPPLRELLEGTLTVK